jgi:DNA-binding helix-turn-helix protein
MEINKIFSERFSELVFESGITPKELAAVLAIDLTDIYAYLKGKNLPRLTVAIKIADYFCCSMDFLFGRKDEFEKIHCKPAKPFSECFQKLLSERGCKRSTLKSAKLFAKQTIDDWYHGKRLPTIENLIDLAEYFKCSLDYILQRNDG